MLIPEAEAHTAQTDGAMPRGVHGSTTWRSFTTNYQRRNANVDFGSYSADEFLDDMGRVTNYRCDPELTDILIGRSFETLKWMRSKGVRFQPSYGRQAFKVNASTNSGAASRSRPGRRAGSGRSRAQGRHQGGHPDPLRDACDVVIEEDGVRARRDRQAQRPQDQDRRKAVVLACGGFESNAEMRTRYLGPTWIRQGERHALQHGAGINMALAIGASRMVTGRAVMPSAGT